jgi:hypothetical protein
VSSRKSGIYLSSYACADEWKNFQERVGWEEELKESEDLMEELRLWASYRGQTLIRTGNTEFSEHLFYELKSYHSFFPSQMDVVIFLVFFNS